MLLLHTFFSHKQIQTMQMRFSIRLQICFIIIVLNALFRSTPFALAGNGTVWLHFTHPIIEIYNVFVLLCPFFKKHFLCVLISRARVSLINIFDSCNIKNTAYFLGRDNKLKRVQKRHSNMFLFPFVLSFGKAAII